MKVIYLAGPYRAPTINGIRENIRKAESVAVQIWQMGIAVISPHANTAFFDGAADDSVWLAAGLETAKRCDAIVMLPGWQQSAGSVQEYEQAIRLCQYRFIWPEDMERLYEWSRTQRTDRLETRSKVSY